MSLMSEGKTDSNSFNVCLGIIEVSLETRFKINY